MEAAALWGGISGLLGTLLTYLMDHYRRSQDIKAIADLDLPAPDSIGPSPTTAPVEGSPSLKYMRGLVEILSNYIRPGTTIGYSILLTYLVWLSTHSSSITSAKADELIDSVIYLTTATTLWWFGVRPLQK